MNSELIAITKYCTLHHIDPAFVYSLQQEELITISGDEHSFIGEDELHRLEKFTRLHLQLGIPPESMEVVLNLLEKVQQMQEEMTLLRSRLKLFEQDAG